MSLDISFYKANKYEWREYTKDKKVDIYTLLRPVDGDGYVDDFPPLTYLGAFYGYGWNEFTNIKGVENCILTEITKDDLQQILKKYEAKKDMESIIKSMFDAWVTAVYNTTDENNEVLLVCCDW